MGDESAVSVESEVTDDVINVDDGDGVLVVKNGVSVGVSGMSTVGTCDVDCCGGSVLMIVDKIVEAASKWLWLRVNGYATAVALFVF